MVPHRNWKIDAVSDPSTGFYIKVDLSTKLSSQDKDYQTDTFYYLEAILYIFHVFPLILLQKRIKNLEWIFLPLLNQQQQHNNTFAQDINQTSSSTMGLVSSSSSSSPLPSPSPQLPAQFPGRNIIANQTGSSSKAPGGVPLTSHRFPSGTTVVSRSSQGNKRVPPQPSLQSSSLKASKVVRFDPSATTSATATPTTQPSSMAPVASACFPSLFVPQQQFQHQEGVEEYGNEDEIYHTAVPESHDIPSSLRRSNKIPIEMTANKSKKDSNDVRKPKQLPKQRQVEENDEDDDDGLFAKLGTKRKSNPYRDTTTTTSGRDNDEPDEATTIQRPKQKQKQIEEILDANNQPKQPVDVKEMHPKQMSTDRFKDLLRMAKKTVK
jgi:hypothetical protein